MTNSNENKETEICANCGHPYKFHEEGKECMTSMIRGMKREFCPCKKFTPVQKGSQSPQIKKFYSSFIPKNNSSADIPLPSRKWRTTIEREGLVGLNFDEDKNIPLEDLPNYDKKLSPAKNFRKAIEREGLVGLKFDEKGTDIPLDEKIFLSPEGHLGRIIFDEGVLNVKDVRETTKKILDDIKKPKRFPYKSSSSLYFLGLDDMRSFIIEIIKSRMGRGLTEE